MTVRDGLRPFSAFPSSSIPTITTRNYISWLITFPAITGNRVNVVVMKTAKKEFENLVYQGIKSQGIDELSSRLIAILYSEPDPVTLEELSVATGYSFSAVSATMKLLSGINLVEKTKKPGSKKLYFSVQRNMLTLTIAAIRAKSEFMVAPALNDIPGIIEKCKKSKAEGSERTLRVIEQYYRQMLALDLIFKNLIEYTEKIQKEMITE
ncbi:MAG: hypothetical protein PWP63_926 [Methanolobus sp.]|nr:hypothetical protein [Methanolobus sp.]